MNKFNLKMSVVIAVTVVFFGIGIIQKANYKVAEGDTVSIKYSIIDGEKTYDSQSASVVIGDNENKIFTDGVLVGLKYGSTISFDTQLVEDVEIDDETTIKKGEKVKIYGKLSEVTPKSTDDKSEVDSDTDSDTDSEVNSDTDSETK